MSLQSRLASLITAIGADIKSLQTQINNLPGAGIPVKRLTAVQTSISLSGENITALSGTSLAPGRYFYRSGIIWRSSLASVGAGFWPVTVGGTVTKNVGHLYTLTTGGAAATGIADQATVAATAQMMEGRGWRASADPGTFLGVDTASADILSIMEGIIVVTAQTTLNLMVKAEAAGTISVEEGSFLKIETLG